MRGLSVWLLLPILVRVLSLFLFVVIVGVVGRFQLQRLRPNHFQSRATFIATDGVAFIHIFFIHVDYALAFRTRDHLYSSQSIAIYTIASSARGFQVTHYDHIVPVRPGGVGEQSLAIMKRPMHQKLNER